MHESSSWLSNPLPFLCGLEERVTDRCYRRLVDTRSTLRHPKKHALRGIESWRRRRRVAFQHHLSNSLQKVEDWLFVREGDVTTADDRRQWRSSRSCWLKESIIREKRFPLVSEERILFVHHLPFCRLLSHLHGGCQKVGPKVAKFLDR